MTEYPKFRKGDTVRLLKSQEQYVKYMGEPYPDGTYTVEKTEDDEEGKYQYIYPQGPGGVYGGWMAYRFELVKQDVSAKEKEEVVNNNAMTWEVAALQAKKLQQEGFTDVSIRPRSWDTKGLYAAVVVTEAGALTKGTLYTPEKVDDFIRMRKPQNLLGQRYGAGTTWRFQLRTYEFLKHPGTGLSYFTEAEIVALNGVVRDKNTNRLYRLGRLDFVPFVPEVDKQEKTS